MPYSIIIPIFNEEKTLKTLLRQLIFYFKEGHEILIVNDGSTDNTNQILNNNNFVNVLHLKKNCGKGIAVKVGLFTAKNDKVIIYDGDLELDTSNIQNLMLLDHKLNIRSVMGYRFKKSSPFNLTNDWGNFIFTTFFNLLYKTTHRDILCCAKSFFKSDLKINLIKSISFDIDAELTAILSINNRGKKIKHVNIGYTRRSISDGKKLETTDGWKILSRIILTSCLS